MKNGRDAKPWRVPEDTVVADGLSGNELKAACIWEMLRGMTPTQRDSIGGTYADAAKDIMVDCWARQGMPLGEKLVLLEESWTELGPDLQKRYTTFATRPSTRIVDDETGRGGLDPGTGDPVAVDGFHWQITAKLGRPARQRVGLEIDWREGRIAIERSISAWLEAQAPKGSPGFGKVPDPTKGRRGLHPDMTFEAALRQISIIRRRDNGETIESIAKTCGDRSESFVRHSRRELAKKYHDWLGMQSL